ncbi:MAG TPA: protoglobin domain-containing protein, partial [Nitrospira sp.]|nr:protoglobin domain-containing protein [Nitrospira sp.]
MSQQTAIPGYTYGAAATSPVTVADFELMKKSALFGDEDVKYLRLSHDIVKDQVEAILDVWYGFVGSQPHLLKSFLGKSDGKPLGDYLGGVRKRFGQWILDTACAEYDQKWLNYQHEIGLRHHRTK